MKKNLLALINNTEDIDNYFAYYLKKYNFLIL